MDTPLRRHPNNPILDATVADGGAVLAFNPAVTRYEDAWVMAFRVDLGEHGDPNLTGTSIEFAHSIDGVSWTVDPARRLDRDQIVELLAPLEPHRSLDLEIWRAYDPRLAVLDDHRLALTLAVDTISGLRPALLIDDGGTWRAESFGPPDNRNVVLFPERVDGRFARLERPMNTYGGAALGAGRYGIWVSRSPDLVHWGDTRLICAPDQLPRRPQKIGPGPPPIPTSEGWLCIIHEVHELESRDHDGAKRGWEATWNKRYEATALLLDLRDPSRLRSIAPGPLLGPEADYERFGFRNDVIFPTGAVCTNDPDPQLMIYYGAADSVIALATGSLRDVLDFTLSGERTT